MSDQPVILVTGASSGIGAATARLFGSSGYRVVLAARSLDKLNNLAEEIRAGGGEATPVETDVTKPTDVQTLVAKTIDQYGVIDVLFNNAGIGRLGWLETLDPEKDIRNQIEANLLGVIWTAQAVLPHMIARRSGHIINVCSMGGLVASPTYSIYSASKFGVHGFTQSLRREVGIYGVRVSAIYPGGVKTGFAKEAVAKRKTGITTPKWLALTADDVARASLHLARHPRRMRVLPATLRAGYWFNLLLPGLADWVVERTFTIPERS